MKKLSMLCLLLVLVQRVYALDVKVAEKWVPGWVAESVSLLGKPVPDGFTRLGRNGYRSNVDLSIVVVVKDSYVVLVGYGEAFPTTHEAAEFLGLFYTFFEDNKDWNYHGEFLGDTYYNNDIGVYAVFVKSKRDDGLIVAAVRFAKDIRLLYE
jgi:hypothetical protein